MVNAFDQSGAADPRGPRVLANVPEPRVSAAEITAPMAAIAASVGALGQKAEEWTADMQRQAGAESVTRGPDGAIQLQTRPLELGRGDREFNAAARQGALAMFQNDAAKGVTDLHNEYSLDPAGFETAGKNFSREMAKKLPPELRTMGEQHVGQLLTQHRDHIANNKVRVDTDNQKTSLTTQLEDRKNTLIQLARQGGTATPEFQQARDNIRDTLDALVANPKFGVPREAADADLRRLQDLATNENTVAHIDGVFDRAGAVGARAYVRDEIVNKMTSLTDADRNRLAAVADARISYREGVRKEQASINRTAINTAAEAVKANKPLPVGTWDRVIARAIELGDQEGHTIAELTRQAWGEGGALQAVQQLPDAARRRALFGDSGATGPGTIQPSIVVFGDSHGKAIRGAGRFGGDAEDGRSPDEVLAALKGGDVRGRNVIISTGTANRPAEVEKAAAQIDAARAGGAVSIMVVGVGPKFGAADARLKQIAEAKGAGFTPLESGGAFQPDGVHLASYGGLTRSMVGNDVGGSAGGSGGAGSVTAKASPAVISAIQAAAAKHGVSENLLNRIAQIESRFDPNAYNPSGATGLFQFMPGTWKDFGAGQNPRDPAANADAAARLVIANRDALRAGLGREPTDGEIYLAHQQGAGSAKRGDGAIGLLKNPGAPAYSVVGKAAVLQNGGTLDMTAGQFAQLWVGKFDRGPGVNVVPGGGYTTPTAGGGGGLRMPSATALDASSPYALTQTIKIAGAREDERIKFVSDLARTALNSLKHGDLPSPEIGGLILQMGARYPAQLGQAAQEVQAHMEGAEVATQLGAGSVPSAKARLAEMRATAQGSGDLYEQMRVRAVDDWLTRDEKRFQSDPLSAGAQRGWFAALPPLDFSTPASIAKGMDARGAASVAIASHDRAAVSLVSKGDADSLATSFSQANPTAIKAFVYSILRQPGEAVDATLKDPNFISTLKGLAMTDDPDRHNAVMEGMSAIKGRNLSKFADAFGQDTLKQVQGWERTSRFLTTDELKKQFALKNDSDASPIAKEWQSAAEKKARELDPEKVAKMVAKYAKDQPLGATFGDRSPLDPTASAAMIAELASMAGQSAIQARGDADKALEMGAERLGSIYAISALNNGRFTRFAPERYTLDKSGRPATINGKFDWMRTQLQDDLWAHVGPDPRSPLNRLLAGDVAGATGIRQDIEYHLVPTNRTDNAISQGKPPVYQLVYKTPWGNGVWNTVQWYPDHEKAMAPERERLQRLHTEALANRERMERSGPMALPVGKNPGPVGVDPTGAPSLIDVKRMLDRQDGRPSW